MCWKSPTSIKTTPSVCKCTSNIEPFAKLEDALGACADGLGAPVPELVGLVVVVPGGFVVVELPAVVFGGTGEGADGVLGGIFMLSTYHMKHVMASGDHRLRNAPFFCDSDSEFV